jgi:CBS domain-containing protein
MHDGSSQATAADLMSPNPVSIHGDATIEELLAFLTDTGFSAAPVIDDAGHPLGVVSRTDVVVYERSKLHRPDLVVRTADLMTPTVFAVALGTPILEVADRMADLNVHRLFVVDQDGALVGVISALDLLRHLAHAEAMAPS